MYSDYVKSNFRSFKSNKQFITAPIYYVNGEPHLGHLYTSVAVDVLHRFASMFGESFLSVGTDEHGQKVEQAAKNMNFDVQEYVDKMFLPFSNLIKEANVSFDAFIRTTSNEHKKVVLEFWDKLLNSGDIYEGKYEGWYSTRDEQFYAEDEVEDGIAKISGSPVEWMNEACMFFKLSKYKNMLLDFYKQNPHAISPISRYNEVIGMLESDIPDLAITRSRFSWGIGCGNGQVIYVWVDALSNYITAMKNNVDYWINDMIHIIGKDILKFHAIYWPALLFAAKYPAPKKIYAHGWWTVNGQKMSKSLGNVISPFELLDQYGVDETRYCIMKEMNFGNDGDFDHDRMKSRINAELVNSLGNLSQRILMFSYKEFGTILSIKELSDNDVSLLIEWDKCLELSFEAMQKQEIHIYLDELRKVLAKTNQYIDSESPWKKDIDEKKRILGVGMECLKRLGILIYPIMPNKSQELLNILGVSHDMQNWFKALELKELSKPGVLFQRILSN